MMAPLNLYDFSREQLRAHLVRGDINRVHVARLWNYLYVQQVSHVDAMSALPPRLQAYLSAETTVGVLPPALTTDSSDGFTRKFLLGLTDGRRVETVKMRFAGRVTACVSSQVGCAMGCIFCATGQMGFTRHLTAGEIVSPASAGR